jgi:transcriptional regulator with XRE-family HTH domain
VTDEELYKFIGLRIKAEREDMEMSQERLAQCLGMTRTSISNIENGQQRVQLHTLYQIARSLSMPVMDLIPHSSNKFAVDEKHLKMLSRVEREWVKSFLASAHAEGASNEQAKDKVAIDADPNELLKRAEIVTPPVPVERLAHQCGATIRYAPHEGEMSGLLFHGVGETIIGVNSLHPKVRQRFAIAHELGHLALHGIKGVHLDRNFSSMRGQGGTSKLDAAESEANKFAVDLLIPAVMLSEDLKNKSVDFSNGEMIGELAERYKVGLEVMTYRLTTIDLTHKG